MTEAEIFKEVELHCPMCRGSIFTPSTTSPPTMPSFGENGTISFLTPKIATCEQCGFIALFDLTKLQALAEKRRTRRLAALPSEFLPRRSG